MGTLKENNGKDKNQKSVIHISLVLLRKRDVHSWTQCANEPWFYHRALALFGTCKEDDAEEKLLKKSCLVACCRRD